jgi:hypothetical protein
MGSILVARLPAAAVMLLLLLVVVAHAERHPLEVKFDHLQPLSRIGLHRQLAAISSSVKISASPEVLGADVSQEEEEASLSLLFLLLRLLLFGFFFFCIQFKLIVIYLLESKNTRDKCKFFFVTEKNRYPQS